MDTNIREKTPREVLADQLAKSFIASCTDYKPSKKSAEIALVGLISGIPFETFKAALDRIDPEFAPNFDRVAIELTGRPGLNFPR